MSDALINKPEQTAFVHMLNLRSEERNVHNMYW